MRELRLLCTCLQVRHTCKTITLSGLGDGIEYHASVKLMLLYLAGTGHRPYSKNIAGLLDEIENLDDETLQTFKDGYFVVRRTDRPFAAVSLDLDIEQRLMAPLKGNGGLSHGRTFFSVDFINLVDVAPGSTRGKSASFFYENGRKR